MTDTPKLWHLYMIWLSVKAKGVKDNESRLAVVVHRQAGAHERAFVLLPTHTPHPLPAREALVRKGLIYLYEVKYAEEMKEYGIVPWRLRVEKAPPLDKIIEWYQNPLVRLAYVKDYWKRPESLSHRSS